MEPGTQKNSGRSNSALGFSHPQEIAIADFTYDLPEEKIAQYPLAERDSSKLLVYRNGEVFSQEFRNIDHFLPSDSLLVFNNSKVIQARLLFTTSTGSEIEIFCLEPYFHGNTTTEGTAEWKCFVGKAKKWKENTLHSVGDLSNNPIKLSATQLFSKQDYFVIRFEWEPVHFTFDKVLYVLGFLPLPPYMKREATDGDKERYQTIYAKNDGSVAAPTAGLHFTENVLEKLRSKNISLGEVTLHVGAGTFKPVKSPTIGEHPMHDERVFVSKTMILKLLDYPENCTAVGTTSMRSLESLYWLGLKIHHDGNLALDEIQIEQWLPYEEPKQDLSVAESLNSIINYMDVNNLDIISFRTFILIAPGYSFKVVNRLITNFHQPESTLLLLVAAFIGPDWKKVYQFALENQFRFLSYGDSSILFRNDKNQ